MRLWLLLLVPGCASARPDALLELARAQDPARLDELATALGAAAPRTRTLAAFALGQLGTAWQPVPEPARIRAESRLLERLAVERDADVRDRVVEALGKLAGPRGLEALIAELGRPHGARARAAIAIGLRARNKVPAPAALPALATLLTDADDAVRYGAVYGLVQHKLPAARAALGGCLADRVVAVRALCAKGLADVGSDDDVPGLAALLADRSPLVAAEAARSLAKLAARCPPEAACRPLAALDESPELARPQVMEAISFEPLRHPAARAMYRSRFDAYEKEGPLDRRTRGLLQCKAALGHDRAAGALALVPRCGLGEVDARRRGMLAARALGQASGHEGDRVRALGELARRPEAGVRMAAAEALGEIDREAVAAPLLALLEDPDLGVLEAAAGAVEKRKLVAAAPRLAALLPRLGGPDAIETAQAVLSALGALGVRATADAVGRATRGCAFAVCLAAAAALEQLTGQKAALAPVPPAEGPWARDPLPAEASLQLDTSRGRIRVRLYPADAPRNVRSLLWLVRHRFFDGLSFHRVVPGFVSQGGDPRGDGSGGPGWALPCEINLRRYAEGSLGMALAGRDTGGSQFFFAHGPQPHLDGRYTIMGQIVEGMEVAESLIEGDLIVHAQLLAP